MQYMLDTDISSYIIRKRDPRLLATLQTQARSGAGICVSSITYAELRLGAERSQSPAKHHAAIGGFCARLSRIAAWDKAAADKFASLQAKLFDDGEPIGRNDSMIAAHALSLDCVLVTNNQRHFSRVPALALENWHRTAQEPAP